MPMSTPEYLLLLILGGGMSAGGVWITYAIAYRHGYETGRDVECWDAFDRGVRGEAPRAPYEPMEEIR